MLKFLTDPETEDDVEHSHFHIKSMKTSRGFTQPNRILSFLRFGSGVTLISAAAAMAFVAANNSSPLLSGKSGVKREASSVRSKDFANNFRRLHHGAFETSLAAVKGGGEPESIDGAAQWDYDNRAYPATSIGVAQQLAAANAAKAIAKLPGGKKTNWQEVGPRGVSADALVASESTGASTGIIYSGRSDRNRGGSELYRCELRHLHRGRGRRRLAGRQCACPAAELASVGQRHPVERDRLDRLRPERREREDALRGHGRAERIE